MKLRADRVGGLAKEIDTLCTASTSAHQNGDVAGSRNMFKNALTKVDEMQGIVDKYSKAFNGNKSCSSPPTSMPSSRWSPS